MESYKINVDKETLKKTSEMLGVRVCVCNFINNYKKWFSQAYLAWGGMESLLYIVNINE